MTIDFTKAEISKTKGKITPAAKIDFKQLEQFIQNWNSAIGPKLAAAQNQINKWRFSPQSAPQMRDMLFGIVVTFGEGQKYVWPNVLRHFTQVYGVKTAIDALTVVDANVQNVTGINISSLFERLKAIKGLGSKKTEGGITKCAYASKVLRCLSDKHVVLDSLIEGELGEIFYSEFRQKCDDIGKAMNPFRSPAQVEGGLFVWLQTLKPSQRLHRWKPGPGKAPGVNPPRADQQSPRF
jgi:hypothetical protein